MEFADNFEYYPGTALFLLLRRPRRIYDCPYELLLKGRNRFLALQYRRRGQDI